MRHARAKLVPDLAECVPQPLQDGWPELGIGLHDLAHKENDVQGTGCVGIPQEVHKQVDYIAGHIRELQSTPMDGLHRQGSAVRELQ